LSFHTLLGIRIVERHEDGLTVECPVRPELLNGAGIVHGGVTASIADSAMGMAIWESFHGKRRTATIEFKINYLRPVSSGTIVARSHIIRSGTTIAVGRVDLFDDDRRLVAIALMTFIVMPETPAGPQDHPALPQGGWDPNR
jgi:uncharacterized protein (TIGR00369 family)